MLTIKLIRHRDKFKRLILNENYLLTGNKLYDGDVWIGTVTAEDVIRCFERVY